MEIEEKISPLTVSDGGLSEYSSKRTGKMIVYSKDGIKWEYGSEAPYKQGVHKAAKSMGIKDGEMIHAKDTAGVFKLTTPYRK